MGTGRCGCRYRLGFSHPPETRTRGAGCAGWCGFFFSSSPSLASPAAAFRHFLRRSAESDSCKSPSCKSPSGPRSPRPFLCNSVALIDRPFPTCPKAACCTDSYISPHWHTTVIFFPHIHCLRSDIPTLRIHPFFSSPSIHTLSLTHRHQDNDDQHDHDIPVNESAASTMSTLNSPLRWRCPDSRANSPGPQCSRSPSSEVTPS
jgi:hypothetical protein